MPDSQDLMNTVQKAHVRTDALDRRVTVLEHQMSDLRAEVRSISKVQSDDSVRLTRMDSTLSHVRETVDRLNGRVWTQLAGGGVGGAGLTYVLLQVLQQ